MSWLKRSQKLPSSDIAERFITVTDVKHYCYCPRIVYFEKVMHAEPRFESQQEESRKMHEELDEKEKRRKGAVYYSKELLEAEKLFRVPLTSVRLGLQGMLDCLVRTGTEYVPVEYKSMMSNGGRAWRDHKYQLAAYALLIEENYGTVVKRGYIDYIPEKLVVYMDITSGVKRYAEKIVHAVHSMIMEEKLQLTRVPPNKCTGGCGYKWICYVPSLGREKKRCSSTVFHKIS